MLRTLVLWTLLSLMVILAMLGVLFGLFSWQLQRKNRVDPDHETMAPLLWLWSPLQPARMHRRLQRVTVPLRVVDAQAGTAAPTGRRARKSPVAAPAPGSAAGIRRSVIDQAVELDRQVVLAARRPRPVRRQAMAALGTQIGEVERLTTRIVHLHAQSSAPPTVPGYTAVAPSPPQILAEVGEQLDLLEQAHGEMLEIEMANGLLDPDAVLRATARPTPAPAVAADHRPPRPPTGRPVSPPMGASVPPPSAPAPSAQPAPIPAPAPSTPTQRHPRPG